MFFLLSDVFAIKLCHNNSVQKTNLLFFGRVNFMSVLIVDDESEILKTLEGHFAIEGIEVTTTTSAKEALELQKKNLFPVVLSDIRMPGMDGVELTKKIKAIHATSIIFIMTGYASFGNLVQCLELGAVDYFKKPFEEIEFVISSVKQALERHARWRKDLKEIFLAQKK